MRHADVAVVVPVFNRANAVLETLATIAQQTVPPRRLIVVDDGSTDGTAASVRAWIARTKPGFEAFVIEQPNRGAGAARNRGIREIGDCRYIAFLDSDDHWPADFLARTVERMEANPAAVAVSADREYHRLWKSRVGQRSSSGLQHGATVWLLAVSFVGRAAVGRLRCFAADGAGCGAVSEGEPRRIMAPRAG
jgi:glycosyltransferase involved in cell wall biosynthesis